MSALMTSKNGQRRYRAGVRLDDLLQEVHELNIRVLLVILAVVQFPGRHIQRREQRGGAVAPVVMSPL